VAVVVRFVGVADVFRVVPVAAVGAVVEPDVAVPVAEVVGVAEVAVADPEVVVEAGLVEVVGATAVVVEVVVVVGDVVVEEEVDVGLLVVVVVVVVVVVGEQELVSVITLRSMDPGGRLSWLSSAESSAA
jgi:hypothetical protein